MSRHWKWQVLPEGQQNLRGRVFSGVWFHNFPGASSDEVKYFTMVVPQESGQLAVSRLGDAIRSAGMNPTASEVGNSVQLSFHLFRMEKTWKNVIFWYLFWSEKLKRYWSSNQSWVIDVVIFFGPTCSCLLDHFLCTEIHFQLQPWIHEVNFHTFEIWKVSQMLPATEAGLTLERFQQLMQVRIEGRVICFGWRVSLAYSGPI